MFPGCRKGKEVTRMAGKLDLALEPIKIVEFPDCKNCGNYPLCDDYTRCVLLDLEWEGGYDVRNKA
jgi:hypothetical protein